MVREILFYGDYFLDFYFRQNKKTQEKIDFVLDIVRNVQRVPIKFLKFLEGTDGLYEIRAEYQSNIYRILCFFDSGNLVVLINSFQKKSGKLAKKEIKLGEKLKREYFQNKLKSDKK